MSAAAPTLALIDGPGERRDRLVAALAAEGAEVRVFDDALEALGQLADLDPSVVAIAEHVGTPGAAVVRRLVRGKLPRAAAWIVSEHPSAAGLGMLARGDDAEALARTLLTGDPDALSRDDTDELPSRVRSAPPRLPGRSEPPASSARPSARPSGRSPSLPPPLPRRSDAPPSTPLPTAIPAAPPAPRFSQPPPPPPLRASEPSLPVLGSEPPQPRSVPPLVAIPADPRLASLEPLVDGARWADVCDALGPPESATQLPPRLGLLYAVARKEVAGSGSSGDADQLAIAAAGALLGLPATSPIALLVAKRILRRNPVTWRSAPAPRAGTSALIIVAAALVCGLLGTALAPGGVGWLRSLLRPLFP